MDKTRFDSLAKSLAGGASRRDVLKRFAAVAAGGAVVISGASGASAGNAWGRSRVAICHHTSDPARPYLFKKVARPALKGHLRHGDVECPPNDACKTYDSCVVDALGAASCGFTAAAAGTACVDATSGLASICDGLGTCAPVVVEPPVV